MAKVDRRTLDILTATLPPEAQEVTDYLLQVKQVASEKPGLEAEIEAAQGLERHPKLVEAEKALQKSVDALSGAMKVIEQTYGEAQVQVPAEEKKVRKAIRRVFGEDVGEISFDMYRQVIEAIRGFSDSVREGIVNEQG